VWALVKERLYLAIALVTASVLVKYATIVLLPLFLIYGIWHQSSWSRRLLFASIAIGEILLMSILAYWPFWSGTTTIHATLNEDNVYMASFATLLQTLGAGQFPLSQGKLIGRVIYGGIYLYSVYPATKRSSKALLRGSFLALFFLIALATSKFEIWYALWPVVLAILTGRRSLFLAAFLLTYGASLSVTLYVYIWFWMGINDQTVQIIHSTAYALTFVPALLLPVGMALRKQLRLLEAPPGTDSQQMSEISTNPTDALSHFESKLSTNSTKGPLPI
jgi:fumarate reductase subunit D